MHAKYEVYTYNGSKVIAKVKVDNKQTNKQTDRQTKKQTDRTKTICPRSFDPGHKNIFGEIKHFFLKLRPTFLKFKKFHSILHYITLSTLSGSHTNHAMDDKSIF